MYAVGDSFRVLPSLRASYTPGGASPADRIAAVCREYGPVEAWRVFQEMVGNAGAVAPMLPCLPSCRVVQRSILFECGSGERIVCVGNPFYCTSYSHIIAVKKRHSDEAGGSSERSGSEETGGGDDVEKKLHIIEEEILRSILPGIDTAMAAEYGGESRNEH